MNYLLGGSAPRVGAATVRVTDDARVRWEIGERAVRPGDGVAAAVVDLFMGAATPAGHGARERAIGVDQTNLSVIVDERWVVKLVAAWGLADRAAAQLERLAAAGSTDVPAYAGTVSWRHPERGDAVLAIVTAYVPGSDDGWEWVPEGLALAARGGELSWAADIGALVGRMHTVLISESRPSRSADGSLLRARALAGLERMLAGTDDDAAAVRIRRRATALRTEIDLIPDVIEAPVGVMHGDLHVGQLLRVRASEGTGRLVAIDFDGDPQLIGSAAECETASTVDLAQLLVSVDLAAAVAQRRAARVLPGIADAVVRAQETIIAAYRAEVGERGGAAGLDDRSLRGLMAARLIAEISYADAWLPRWRYAPDWAISIRFAPVSPDEEPWTPPVSPTTSP